MTTFLDNLPEPEKWEPDIETVVGALRKVVSMDDKQIGEMFIREWAFRESGNCWESYYRNLAKVCLRALEKSVENEKLIDSLKRCKQFLLS
jgi:hypothetical protein